MFEVAAYVTEEISVPLIIGNPIIDEYPELLTMNADNTIDEKVKLEIDFIDTEKFTCKLDNRDEFWVLQINEMSETSTDTFNLLPPDLKTKYECIIRNDLPNKKHQKKDMTQYEIHIKPGGRLSHLQLYRLTPKTEKNLANNHQRFIGKGFYCTFNLTL